MAIDDPSIQTDHAAKNLDSIIKAAGSRVIEEDKSVLAHEEGKRREAGAQIEMARGNVEANVYGDIAMEFVGGTVGKLLKHAKDSINIIEDGTVGGPDLEDISKKNPLIASKAGTFEDGMKKMASADHFPLSDRVKNISKFFSGESDAVEDKVKPATQGIEGKQDIQVTYASKLLNQQKYDQALALQRDYSAQLAHRQMAMGMTPNAGLSPRMGMTPKAPDFKGIEEEPTNWGIGNVTG